MINIKELSVGNWVYNKHHGKAIQITPFDFFTHTQNKEEKQCLVGNPNLVSGKDFEPIPISPEILEKNGWKVRVSSINPKKWVAYLAEKDVLILKNSDLVTIHTDTGEGISFRYVHQLQNALTLCGIDKNIEL